MHYINISYLLHISGKNNVLILLLCIQFNILKWPFGNGLWVVVTTSSPETGRHLADQRQNWAKVCANISADGEHIPELSPGPVNVLMHTKPIIPSALDKCLIRDRSSL